MILMDKIMESMVGQLSIEKKQEMMLKMMPMMMQDVNMAETMLRMIPTMVDNISLLDIFNMLKKLFPNILKGMNSITEFIAEMDVLAPKMIQKMPQHMEKMMPIMQVLIPLMMGKVMPIMMTDKNLDIMEQCPNLLLPKMLDNKNVREHMPKMMIRMMPCVLEQMLPRIADDKKSEFIKRMQSILDNTKN
jgi:hypothetical protein